MNDENDTNASFDEHDDNTPMQSTEEQEESFERIANLVYDMSLLVEQQDSTKFLYSDLFFALMYPLINSIGSYIFATAGYYPAPNEIFMCIRDIFCNTYDYNVFEKVQHHVKNRMKVEELIQSVFDNPPKNSEGSNGTK